MDAETMLSILSEYGDDAYSDYNDSEEVDGWFGWTINGNILTITYKPDDGTESTVMRKWQITEIEGEK